MYTGIDNLSIYFTFVLFVMQILFALPNTKCNNECYNTILQNVTLYIPAQKSALTYFLSPSSHDLSLKKKKIQLTTKRKRPQLFKRFISLFRHSYFTFPFIIEWFFQISTISRICWCCWCCRRFCYNFWLSEMCCGGQIGVKQNKRNSKMVLSLCASLFWFGVLNIGVKIPFFVDFFFGDYFFFGF